MSEGKQKPAFSIIIPVHNGEQFIAAALGSVLSQTYPHFNIVILENCSTDKTLDTIHTFDDPRIEIIPSSQPLSIERNWARILDLDLNEYMTILGHDDLLYPDFLQEMVALTQREPEASLYHSHFYFIDIHGKIIDTCQPMPYQETSDQFLAGLHRFEYDSYATGYVMRSDDYLSEGGIPRFPDLMYADHFLWYTLAKKSYKVCNQKVLFAYRIHEKSAAHTTKLLTLYDASKAYLQALSQTAHFQQPENETLAYHFVGLTFRGLYHKQLFELMGEPTSHKWDEYLSTKQILL